MSFRHRFLLLFIVATITDWPRVAWAGRPLATEDAGVAGSKVAQLETSIDYLKWGNGDEEGVLLATPIYGIISWWEMSIEIPWMFHDPQDRGQNTGVGDISVVTKFLILNEGGMHPAFALKGVVKTPSGDADSGLGSGDFDYTVAAVASKGIGPLMLHSMFGYTFVGMNGDPNIHDVFLYGLAADWGLTERLHLVAEINGRRHTDRQTDLHPLDGLVGATFRLSDSVTIDGGLRLGFNDYVPDINTTVGASFTF